jgi:hypothetical protein
MQKLTCRPPNPARLLPVATLAGLILVLMAISLVPWLTPSSRAQSASCNSAWNIVPSPNPATGYNVLLGVAAVSPGDVWAVGQASLPAVTLAEHWDGGNWSVVPGPNVSGIASLNGVSAVSSSDVWAVGSVGTLGSLKTLIEHWNGSTWSVVPSPSPDLSDTLQSVAAVSASDVWAVGAKSVVAFTGETLIEHWDGSNWSIVPSPSPGESAALEGVAAVSSSDVWAVGSSTSGNSGKTLIEHWDGSSWSVVPSPSPDRSDNLRTVSAVSSSDVWAVGGRIESSIGQDSALIEHWDGSNWTAVASPIPPGPQSELNGIAAISSGNIWAVGDLTLSNASAVNTLAEHWDGNSWQIVSSPSVGGAYGSSSSLTGVAAASASDIWAVGTSQVVLHGPIQTLVEHFCAGATSRTWGDGDCSGDIGPRDAQAVLKNVLVQDPLSQTQPCPAVGAQVTVDGVSRIWSDWDCSGDIGPRDAQAVLKNVLVQDPLSQTQPCPAVGSTVQVVG